MTYTALNRFLGFLLIGLCFSTTAFAQSNNSPTLNLQLPPQTQVETVPVALEGIDVVTYFLASGPEQGQETYQIVHNGHRYLFKSPENQRKFSADPSKYLPEFGEYCACAVSENKRVQADPNVFKITEGKLVLFEDNKALSLWEEDEEGGFAKAQKFWEYQSKDDANKRLREDTRVRVFSF